FGNAILRAFPEWVSQGCLFGAASEIEISLESEVLGFDLIQNGGDDALGSVPKSRRCSRLIGDDDAKEKRDVPLHIIRKAVHDANDVGRESAFRALNSGSDSALIN